MEWLPVLFNIAPSDLRRSQALLKEYNNILDDPGHPAYNDSTNQRLKSRKPPLSQKL